LSADVKQWRPNAQSKSVLHAAGGGFVEVEGFGGRVVVVVEEVVVRASSPFGVPVEDRASVGFISPSPIHSIVFTRAVKAGGMSSRRALGSQSTLAWYAAPPFDVLLPPLSTVTVTMPSVVLKTRAVAVAVAVEKQRNVYVEHPLASGSPPVCTRMSPPPVPPPGFRTINWSTHDGHSGLHGHAGEDGPGPGVVVVVVVVDVVLPCCCVVLVDGVISGIVIVVVVLVFGGRFVFVVVVVVGGERAIVVVVVDCMVDGVANVVLLEGILVVSIERQSFRLMQLYVEYVSHTYPSRHSHKTLRQAKSSPQKMPPFELQTS